MPGNLFAPADPGLVSALYIIEKPCQG